MLAEEVTVVEWRARRARKHAQLVEALRAADLPLPGPADPEMSRIVDDATEDPKRGGDDLSGCQVCACALSRVAANQSLRCPQEIKSSRCALWGPVGWARLAPGPWVLRGM